MSTFPILLQKLLQNSSSPSSSLPQYILRSSRKSRTLFMRKKLCHPIIHFFLFDHFPISPKKTGIAPGTKTSRSKHPLSQVSFSEIDDSSKKLKAKGKIRLCQLLKLPHTKLHHHHYRRILPLFLNKAPIFFSTLSPQLGWSRMREENLYLFSSCNQDTHRNSSSSSPETSRNFLNNSSLVYIWALFLHY